MRGSPGFLALLLVFTQLAPATAGEVFVAQSANRKLSFDKVKTLVARDAGLLASPLPLSTFKPPSQAASNNGTGASAGNVSSVTHAARQWKYGARYPAQRTLKPIGSD